MSIRSKVANTMGPSSLRPVFQKSWTTYTGPGSTSDWVVPPPPGSWLMEDPLSSMANITTNGVGTWDVASGVLNMTSPVDGNRSRVAHSYVINPAHERHVVQVEVRIPTNFSTGTDNNLGVGFGTTSFGNGDGFLAPRYANATNRFSLLDYNIVWVDGPIYAWTSGQWYTIRAVWTPSSTWSGYVDGTFVQTFSKSLTESSSMRPSLFVSRYLSSASVYQFRNLKYWGGALTDTMPVS